MIKANELRIGNIVSFVTATEPAYISCINEEDDGEYLITTTSIKNRKGEWNAERGEDDMIPIPLTPEILEKAGFVKDDKFLYHVEWYSKSMVDVKVLGSLIEVYVGEEKIEIEYLHQLQNLYFALTGQELEINL